MKRTTCIFGNEIVLVPYQHEHVARYHEWMSNPELLELTASEQLTLEQEYKMQKEWADDDKKCTFIILERCRVTGIPSAIEKLENKRQKNSRSDPSSTHLSLFPILFKDDGFVFRNVDAMVGDVNLFLSDIDEDDDIDERKCSLPISVTSACQRKQGELNIMIAEASARQKGLGTEACKLMMFYSIQFLGVQRFFVKISESNFASRQMFDRVLKFKQCHYAKCFQEYELEFVCTEKESLGLLREWNANVDVSFSALYPFCSFDFFDAPKKQCDGELRLLK